MKKSTVFGIKIAIVILLCTILASFLALMNGINFPFGNFTANLCCSVALTLVIAVCYWILQIDYQAKKIKINNEREGVNEK